MMAFTQAWKAYSTGTSPKGEMRKPGTAVPGCRRNDGSPEGTHSKIADE
jgi:hypothetical protein